MENTQTRKRLQGKPENVLGWGIQRTKREEIAKTLRKGKNFLVVELRNNEKKYLLSNIPLLSMAEAQLVHEVLETFQIQSTKKNVHKPLAVFLDEYTNQNQLELDSEQAEYLLWILEKLAFELGPISELLLNDDLEEIAVSGIGKQKPVRVFHKTFGWIATNLFFSDSQTLKNLVNKMARQLGRRLSLQTPRLNAVLEDGSRIHAVIEPLAFSGPCITIRKFRFKPFTPVDLMQTQTVNSETLAFLWLALQSDSTLLVCGNTGSGKTTTLNALFCFVPQNERLILVEETPEIRLPHAHQIKLTSSEELGVGMHALIIDSLRMRPDRIIVGEMRTAAEAKAFMDTLLAGQGKGSYATFHAQSTQEAIYRLKSMGISGLDLASIDLVLVQKRWTKINPQNGFRREERKIVEMAELELKEGTLCIRKLLEWNYGRQTWVQRESSQKVEQKICRTFGLNANQVKEELEKRRAFLESLKKKELEFKKFCSMVNA